MEVNKKKTILTNIGSVLIGIGVIWGAIGYKLKYLPFLLLIIIVGCIFSYMGKNIKK